ncbi:hypothetical protein ACI2K4_00895 [Micromonospora sp. NPDC050397]|uniref:hypothetical protein n=1 Tax=Micromonospora sp. NPDC050397 TaxID=3364279 RepID=UPI00385136B2
MSWDDMDVVVGVTLAILVAAGLAYTGHTWLGRRERADRDALLAWASNAGWRVLGAADVVAAFGAEGHAVTTALSGTRDGHDMVVGIFVDAENPRTVCRVRVPGVGAPLTVRRRPTVRLPLVGGNGELSMFDRRYVVDAGREVLAPRAEAAIAATDVSHLSVDRDILIMTARFWVDASRLDTFTGRAAAVASVLNRPPQTPPAG